MIKLCGLWLKDTKNGKDMLHGKLNYWTRIIILPNKFKRDAKDPDWNLFITPNLQGKPVCQLESDSDEAPGVS